jgi:hypothetical protein
MRPRGESRITVRRLRNGLASKLVLPAPQSGGFRDQSSIYLMSAIGRKADISDRRANFCCGDDARVESSSWDVAPFMRPSPTEGFQVVRR